MDSLLGRSLCSDRHKTDHKPLPSCRQMKARGGPSGVQGGKNQCPWQPSAGPIPKGLECFRPHPNDFSDNPSLLSSIAYQT